MRQLFEQKEVSDITGMSLELLRNWRFRGLLNDIGTLNGRRWEYSTSDLIILTCARWLDVAGFGKDLSSAISISTAILPQVWDFIADIRLERSSNGRARFMIVPPGGPGSARWTIEFPTADTTQGAPAFLIIDCLLIADDLASRLGDIVAGVETGWSSK